MQPNSRFVTYVVLFVLSMLSLSANAGLQDAAPPRGDPFSGILARSNLIISKTNTIDQPGNKSVAVILSDNTEKHLKWSESASGGRTGFDRAMGSLFGGSKVLADSDFLHRSAYDPKIIVASVLDPLIQRFKSVEVVQDLDEFKKGNFDLLAIMDITFVNTFSDPYFFGDGDYDTGSYIGTYFIDRNNMLIGKIEVGETRSVERNKFLFSAIDVRKETGVRYRLAVDALAGHRNIKESLSLTSVSAPKKSARERLAEIEDLLRQGLIKPEEAEDKRKKILEEL